MPVSVRTIGDRPAVTRALAAFALLALLAASGTLLARPARFPAAPVSLSAGVMSGLSTAVWLGGAIIVTVLVIMIVRAAVARARARHDPDEPEHHAEQAPIPVWTKLIVLFVLLGGPAVIIGAMVALSHFLALRPAGASVVSGTAAAPPSASPIPGTAAAKAAGSAAGHAEVWGVVLALVLFGCVAGAVATRHRHSRLLPASPRRATGVGAELGRAVAAGSVAARIPLDPRAAILACYRAMESALARDGVVRRRAETPNDLLLRAARRQLVPSAPAHQLCLLFDEARFSDHPLDAAQRASAVSALEQVRTGLETRS